MFSVFIPARVASTRLPNKPLLLIKGEPMIAHVVRTAFAVHAIKVVVVTDSDDVSVLVKSLNPRVVVHRDLGIFSSGSEACASAAQQLGEDLDSNIVVLQGDMPFANVQDVRNAGIRLGSPKVVTTLVSVIPEADRDAVLADPNRVKCLLGFHQQAIYFYRDVPKELSKPQFFLHHGIYGYRVQDLLALGQYPTSKIETALNLEPYRVLDAGYTIDTRMSEFDRGLSIDVPSDLERANAR